jgi:hypothetical protein
VAHQASSTYTATMNTPFLESSLTADATMMNRKRPATPMLEEHEKNEHQPTPNRAKVQAIIEFNDAHNIPYFKSDVFRHFQVAPRTGWRIISPNKLSLSARTHHNDPNIPETRERKAKLGGADIKRMDHFIPNNGFDARVLTWGQLAEACQIEKVSERTIRRVLGDSLHYSKCLACCNQWVSPSAAQNRLRYATEMLRKYPTPESWRRVRFSDEVHFGLGPQGKLRILRKPGERYCGDCVQEVNEPREKDRKRIHCWAAIGYDLYSTRLKATMGR